MAYLPTQTHIAPLASIRRERRLAVPGQVTVQLHQKVSAEDVVARAVMRPGHHLVDFAGALGLPPDRAARYLVGDPGEEVAEGDTIAGPVGLIRKRVIAPVRGRVVMAENGKVVLEMEARNVELRAGIPGTVVRVEPNEGVTIETVGVLIQGIWGNGKEGWGTLRAITEGPAGELTLEGRDASLSGVVVAAGTCSSTEALEAAARHPLAGLVLGTLSVRLRERAAALGIPVVLTDGFRGQPSSSGAPAGMNPLAFELLKSNSGREAAVDARPLDRRTGHRPEVVIPLPDPGSASTPKEGEALAIGRRVRVLRAPHQGRVGIITALPDRRQTVPSGVRSLVAEVDLAEGERVMAPVANLEILE